jgi:hypothetical protein
VIINEFININEKNNSLSPQIIEHKKSITYGVANKIVAWDWVRKLTIPPSERHFAYYPLAN